MTTSTQPSAAGLIGREQEVQAISELLARDTVRHVTLSGSPGTGKTILARHVMEALAGQFHDGVFWVPLASIADHSFLLSTIARALGIRESSERSLLEEVAAYLQERHVLLVLDDFEHLIAPPALSMLRELLQRSPWLKLLVTSRELLHLYGEKQFVLAPLSLPPLEAQTPPELLKASPAVALFLERARSVQPDLALSPADLLTIARICHRLDGIPLAIELTAAYSGQLDPEQMLQQLDHRFEFLASSSAEFSQRHQTLKATMDWTYGRLKRDEQQLLSVFGVFMGGASLEALESICAATLDIDPIDGLMSLVDKNLIRVEQRESDDRYNTLETIREYALDQLAESGELETLRQQHASYYRAWVEQIEPDSRGARQPLWLDQLELEHNNIRAGLKWLLESGDVEAALQISAAIWVFWQLHGYLTEGRQWMDSAFNHPQTVQSAMRAKALSGAGWLLAVSNKYEEAHQRFREGVELARKLGEKRIMGLSLHGLGSIARQQERYSEAAAAFEESLPLFQAVNDTEHVAWTYQHLGVLALDQGEIESGVSYLEQSLLTFRRLGQPLAIANIKVYQARALQDQSQFQRAVSALQDALTLYNELNAKVDIALCQAWIGQLYLAQDNTQQALEAFQTSFPLAQSLTIEPELAVICLEGIAELARRAGRREQAIQIYAAAEKWREETNTPIFAPMRTNYERISSAFIALRDQPELLEAWQQGQAMSLGQASDYAVEMLAKLAS